MKRNRIFLDFTSLLDIMMIILFFFILNFNGAQEKVNEKIEDYDKKLEQHEADKQKFEEEKEKWQKEAEIEMERIKNADKNAAAMQEALMNLQEGKFLTIDLQVNGTNNWVITVSSGKERIGEIISKNSQNITKEIIDILDNNKFEKDDVILAVLMFNQHDSGSAKVITKEFIENIKSVRYEYQYFYCADLEKFLE